jgi:hypothetical protein
MFLISKFHNGFKHFISFQVSQILAAIAIAAMADAAKAVAPLAVPASPSLHTYV